MGDCFNPVSDNFYMADFFKSINYNTLMYKVQSALNFNQNLNMNYNRIKYIPNSSHEHVHKYFRHFNVKPKFRIHTHPKLVFSALFLADL